MGDLTPLVLDLLPYMKPYFIRTMIWALAKLRNHNGGSDYTYAFQAAGDHLLLTKSLSLSDAAIIAWAFSSAGVDHPALFDSIAKMVMVRRRQLSPQDACNLTWAFAARHHAQRGIKSGTWIPPRHPPSHSVEPGASVRIRGPEMTRAEPSREEYVPGPPCALGQLPSGNTDTEWLDCMARPSPGLHRLVSAVVEAMSGRIREFEPWQLPKMAWALAVLNFG